MAETFTTAWRRRADMPPETAEMRPWLFGSARFGAANVARSSTRADRFGERLSACVPLAGTDPEPQYPTAGRRVRDAMAELSDDDRELVTLIAWEGLTPAQAAVVLGVSAGTARQLVEDARDDRTTSRPRRRRRIGLRVYAALVAVAAA